MKTKLTLSIDAALVRKAKAHSKRVGKSVSELFEEAIEKASSASKPERKQWSDLWAGTVRFTADDAKRDDRVGRMARKVRTRATQHAKQRA